MRIASSSIFAFVLLGSSNFALAQDDAAEAATPGQTADSAPIEDSVTPMSEADRAPTSAAEKPVSMDDKLILKGVLGLGGSADVGSANVDLGPSIGGALQYEHPAAKLLVVGGYVGVQSWTTVPASKFGLGRSTYLDVSLMPKLRYTLNEFAELYLAVLVGASFDFASSESFGGDVNTGIGWNLSGLLGGQIAFTDSFGLMGEMGYGLHSFSHSVSPSAGGAKVDADVAMHQFTATLGLYAKL